MENEGKDEVYCCKMKLRESPQKRKDKVFIGCGAGFAGDRPLAALKLLERVKELDYLVLECLAERTLADRFQAMMSGGDGFDPKIVDWMTLLLPLAVERGVCIITNMGAVDPLGAQKKVLDLASSLGIHITVSVVYQVSPTESGLLSSIERSNTMEGGVSTYMGAAPIVHCLEKHKSHVIITSRVADAALFLGPMSQGISESRSWPLPQTRRYCDSVRSSSKQRPPNSSWFQSTSNHHNPVPGFYWLLKEERLITVSCRQHLLCIPSLHAYSVGPTSGDQHLKRKQQKGSTTHLGISHSFLGFLSTLEVYELGWNWNDFEKLAQGSLAGHLLECGCQLTGGYFMHPGDCSRDLSFQNLLDLSLPYAEVGFHGEVCIAKADGSGGVLNFDTCAEQLLYEVGDPSAYITPDVIIDFRDVSFHPISTDRVLCVGAKPSAHCFPEKLLQLVPMDHGWKGWGEISYGGYGCMRRAKVAELLVKSWLEEVLPGVNDRIISYIIGLDSLKATNLCSSTSHMRDSNDVRLRMDGLFELKQHALHFVNEFTALYTNGPAGGGGISTGHKKEIILRKELIDRECVFWRMEAKQTGTTKSGGLEAIYVDKKKPQKVHGLLVSSTTLKSGHDESNFNLLSQPAPSGQKIPLYQAAHSRAGDKGNDLNFSIIPHFSPDFERLKVIITPTWVKAVVSALLDESSFPDSDAIERRNARIDEHVKVEIYEVKGIHSLNVVVRNILDGGVNCSRRIDRHGKCVSDLVLCQQVVLPP